MSGPGGRGSVRFELAGRDLLAYHRYQLRHSPKIRLRRRAAALITALIWTGAWVGFVFYSGSPAETAAVLWPLLLLIPVHFWLFPALWRRAAERKLEQALGEISKSPLLGKRRLVIDAEGIAEENPFAEIKSPWKKVLKAVRFEGYTFVFLTPEAAFILPQSAFEETAEYEAFVGRIEEWCAKAKGRT